MSYIGATGYTQYEERFQDIEGNISNVSNDLYAGNYSITSNLNRVIRTSSNIFSNLYIGDDCITSNIIKLQTREGITYDDLYVGDNSFASNIKYLKNEVQNETQTNPTKTAVYRIKDLENKFDSINTGYQGNAIIDEATGVVIGNGIATAFSSIGANIANIGNIGSMWYFLGACATAAQVAQTNAATANNKANDADGKAVSANTKADKSLGIWDESGNNVYHKKSGNVGIGITFAGLLNNKLEVNGNINIPLSSNYKINNQPLNYSHLAGAPPVSSKWTNATDTSTNIFYNTGNVGIGKTTNLTNKLEVGGNLNISADSKYKIGDVNLAFSDLGGTLPTAGVGTGGTLGGVKVDGTTITITNQVISAVAGAQQLNSDWTQINTSLKSFILNKPTEGANITFANNQIALSKSQDIELDSGTIGRSYGWFNGSKLARVAVANSISTGSKVNDIVLKSTSNIILQAGFFGSEDTSPPLLEAGIHIDAATNRVKMPHNVGIGTTAHATYKLNVNGTINSTNLLASGSVGIGTISSTIGYKLDVRGSILSDNNIATSGTGFLFAGTTLSGLTRETIASVPIGFFELNDIILRGNNKIHLQSGNSTTIPPAITIGTTNKVGIGATNPNCSLQLHNPATAQDVRIQFTDGTSTSAVDRGIHIRKGTDGVGYMWNFENKDLVFGTNNNERFKIGFDGIVGMGTTTAGVLKIGIATQGAFTAMTKLQVYASDSDGVVAIFKHPNDTQGIGIRYDGLTALGNTATQHIVMRPRGTGYFSVENPTGTNRFVVSSTGVVYFTTNIWHLCMNNNQRFYFGEAGTTYIKGAGTPAIEFRNGSDTAMMKIFSNGAIEGYNGLYAKSPLYESLVYSGADGMFFTMGNVGDGTNAYYGRLTSSAGHTFLQSNHSRNIYFDVYSGRFTGTMKRWEFNINGGSYNASNTTTWNQSSDHRIKENIVKADLKKCYDNVKNINLYRFNYIENFKIDNKDKNILGYIAQEVKKHFPKAITIKKERLTDNREIPDLLSIDVEQINLSLYGAVKQLIKIVEKQNKRIKTLETLLNIEVFDEVEDDAGEAYEKIIDDEEINIDDIEPTEPSTEV